MLNDLPTVAEWGCSVLATTEMRPTVRNCVTFGLSATVQLILKSLLQRPDSVINTARPRLRSHLCTTVLMVADPLRTVVICVAAPSRLPARGNEGNPVSTGCI